MQNIKCVAIDFDSTLAYFLDSDGSAYNDLYDIFVRLGIPLETVDEAYKSSRSHGFSFESLIDELEKRGCSVNRESAIESCKKWLSSNLRAYEDASPAVESWISKEVSVFIVTMGDENFQSQKVTVTGIKNDGVYSVSKDVEKLSILERLANTCGKVLVIDDKATVLDFVRDADPDGERFVTVRMLRKESKYVGQKPRHEHITVTNLLDERIENIIQN